MAYIGYSRVSRNEQNLELQVDTLREKGCTKIFTDKITGTNFDRKELTAALAYLRSGDVLVVWKLDRLGRSLKHLRACFAMRCRSLSGKKSKIGEVFSDHWW